MAACGDNNKQQQIQFSIKDPQDQEWKHAALFKKQQKKQKQI